MLERKMEVNFSIPLTANAFKNINIDFVGKRKWYYIFSSAIILAGVFFFFKNGGFTMGVDFKGGRSYIVRFENPVKTEDVSSAIKKNFGTQSGDQVKTFGTNNQVRITTAYMIDDTSSSAEQVVEQKLKDALNTLNNKWEIIQSQKVGSTISRDLRNNAVWTVILGCVVIFIYILIRFKGWQYGLGTLVALIHDVAVVFALFTILDGVVPFTLEVNQDFIAALLTVIGYSVNDTIIVFDRIREYLAEKSKKALEPGEEKNRIINMALNSTLSRTLITSGTTIFVLIAIFFFGGDVLRPFIFALLAGITVGTYSSLCIGTPIVIDFDRKKKVTE
jgi:SecD/SecF fusion protein